MKKQTNERIKEAVKDILWMSRRYSNGRHTYAPDLFNDAYDILRSELGDDIDDITVSDMQGNTYYDITIEHTKKHPYAVDPDSTQQQQALKKRRYYAAKSTKKTD